MQLFARFNKHGFRVFAQTAGWMLLFALFPASIYTYTHSLWMGAQIFLLFAVVTTLALLWAFWAAIFPKDSGGS